MGTTVVLLALGTFGVVNLLKSLAPGLRFTAATKLLAALLVASLSASLVAGDARQGVMLALPAFGLATLFHTAHRALSARGDDLRASLLQRARVR
jgi:hypothetical protein